MIASLSRGSLLDEVLHGGFNEQQLTAYVSWVNCQLKRKPGLKPIKNLRHDLQDGVVLTQLIEIVAGELLEGVHVAPQNKEESRQNVAQVLQFISSRHIRMPHISARDIVDGNLKSVMRIILALAAHFKPSANHRAASVSERGLTRGFASHDPLSTVALAQGSAAALASAQPELRSLHAPHVSRVAGGWMRKRMCVFVHWLSSTKEELRTSRTMPRLAGKSISQKCVLSIIGQVVQRNIVPSKGM
uniref:DIX domain containing 1 n=1 Tax=Gasterosteus aculeatus aculeatus TaxID=481459 RepID=A0AAQ4S0X5_GASAC